MGEQYDDEQNDDWTDIDPARMQGWAGDAHDVDEVNEQGDTAGASSNQQSNNERRDRGWDVTDKGPGPGQKRRTQTMAMWQPSEWRRMKRKLGGGVCASDADDPMQDNGETADVTGD